jgi:hypothetical protein
MSTNLPILWANKINSPALADFIATHGPEYCMSAEEINQLRDAVNEMAVIQQSVCLGIAEPADTPTGTGANYWEVITPGTYTNFGGVVLLTNSRGLIYRNAAGAFSISQATFDITSKVNVSDIVDNLTTNDETKPLSSKQGKTLKDTNPYGYYGTYASLAAANAAVPSGIRKGKTVGIDTTDGIKEYSWRKGILDTDLILKDGDSLNYLEKRDWVKDYVLNTNRTNPYFKSVTNAIIDIWTEFPSGKPTIWDNPNWELLVGFVGTAPNSNRLIMYYADNTGLTVEGTNIFSFSFGSSFDILNPVEISSTVTIEAKPVIIKSFVDWRKVVADVAGLSFNIGVSLTGRMFKVVKKEKPSFVNAIAYDTYKAAQLVKDNAQDVKISTLETSVAKVIIAPGTNITSTITPVWEEWGYYNASGILQVKDSTWGWKYLAQYIPIYGGVSITVNTAVNDSAPLLLYDKNHNFIRSVGTGTGSTVVGTFTFTTAENEVFLRCSNRAPFTFSIIANTEIQVLANRLTLLENDFNSLGIETKTAIPTIIMPSKIFTTCNDVNRTSGWNENLRGNSVNVYLDRFILLTAKKDAFFKDTKALFKNLASRVYFNPEPVDGVTFMEWNDKVDISEKAISLNVGGSNTMDATLSFTHVSSLSSLSKTKFPKILQIGDSVTEGAESSVNGNSDKPERSWSWVKYFFELDRIESGNSVNDYNALVMGTRVKKTFTATFNGITNNIQACCEGRSGWAVTTYLNTETYNSMTNSFYDVDKVGTNKFSLTKYLSRHKTLADDGKTRLVVGSTAGTLVSDVNNYDVCTPNIVIIQLGFNDVEANYVADLTSLIARIKEEYPTMIIGLSQIDVSGTYFPDAFPEWDAAKDDINILTQIYLKRVHEKMVRVFNAVKALENETNRIFIIPSGFVQPTADSMGYRQVNEGAFLSEMNTKFIKKQAFANSAIGYHPNNYAHACWGYEVYSWVKWLCAKNFI